MERDAKPRTVYWLDDKLYLNITNKCSNACIFCFRNFKRGIGDFSLKLAKEPSFEDVAEEIDASLQRRAWREAVFCGFGEPTARLDLLLELARYLKKSAHKLPIRVNTNGHAKLLNPNRDVVAELKTAGVERISVSLNAADEETYDEVCKPNIAGAFKAVLDFIKEAKQELEVEATAVTTPEIQVGNVEALAKKLGVKFRLRQCIPCFW